MSRLILANPFSKDGLKELDLQTGMLQSLSANREEKINGNMYATGGHLLALYADGDALYVQLDDRRWSLDAPNLRLSYSHDFSLEMTRLTVEDGNEKVEINYPAWWKGLAVNKAVLPELDEDQDYAAYVCSIWRNEQLRCQLLDAWR